uniref:ER membrane protein complex subunit 1 n=1 Tax=Graphocephala atropunctata TaxID=36148 RepID=A0A1B6KS38_9HEMI
MYFQGAFLSCLLFSYLELGSSLYEDQIGKFDWKLNHLGKLKFSSIDLKSPSKKVFVATEENVIAGLSTKTGEILWRQILEKGDPGAVQLMHVDVEMVTVTGSGPYTVRGWNINLGNMLYEWSIASVRWPEVRWAVHQGKLYVASVGQRDGEISVYNVRVGGQPVTHSLSLPHLPDKHNVVVAGLSLVYTDMSGELLVSVPMTGNSPPSTLRLPSPAVSLTPVTGVSDQLFVRVNQHLVAISVDKLRLVDFEIPSDSNIAVHSYTAEQNIIIIVQHSGKELVVSGRVLETGSPVPELSSQLSHVFPLAASHVTSVVCLTRRDKTVTCQLLLSALDHSMAFAQVPGNLMWVREEALTSIVNMELVDLPVSDVEAAIEKEFNIKGGGSLTMLVRRVTSQLLQLQTLLMTVLGLRDPPNNVNGRADLVRDDFGLHKIIVAITSVGKIYGIDNLSHEIIWQFTLEDVIPFNNIGKAHVPFFVQRTTRHFPYPAQCTVLYRHKVTEEAVIYTFNPINGKSQDGKSLRLGYKLAQAVLLASVNEEFLKGLLLLDTTGKVHVYPESARQAAVQAATSTYLYTADTLSGQLTGYSLSYSSDQELVAVPLWEVKLSQKITAIVAKSPLEKVHSQGRVLGDRSVLYKYINPNLVAVLTQTPDPLYKNVLSVYLIDVVSGSVVFSAVHKRSLEPIHVVHSENWVIYSYFSDKSRRTEITTLDLYEGKTQSNTTAFSSVWNPIQPMVERQSYILPASVEMMKETITEKGITSKHILVALNSGGVLELPWVLLDPRRPLAATPDLREEAVIPYVPELPNLPEAIINYNQTLLRVSGIHTSPSGLESTCLVAVYGLDLFYTRVAPSKTFDMLKEDFDYILITAVLVGLTVSAFMTKRLAARKALKQAWK